MDFEEWLIKIEGKSEATAAKYRGALAGRLSTMANHNGLTNNNLLKINNIDEFNSIKVKLIKNNDFIQRNYTGHNMYSCSLDKYSKYLEYKK